MNQPWARMAFWIVVFSALVVMVALNLFGPPTTAAAPLGIISFELAGSAEAANAILAEWGVDGQLRAAFSLGLDYLFIPLYALVFGWAGLNTGRGIAQRGWPLARLGRVTAAAAVAAAICDVLENATLAAILFFGVSASPWPEAARILALIKFGLLFAGLVYIFFGAAIAGVSAAVKG